MTLRKSSVSDPFLNWFTSRDVKAVGFLSFRTNQLELVVSRRVQDVVTVVIRWGSTSEQMQSIFPEG